MIRGNEIGGGCEESGGQPRLAELRFCLNWRAHSEVEKRKKGEVSLKALIAVILRVKAPNFVYSMAL